MTPAGAVSPSGASSGRRHRAATSGAGGRPRVGRTRWRVRYRRPCRVFARRSTYRPPFDLRGLAGMALVAVLDQHRADLRPEEVEPSRASAGLGSAAPKSSKPRTQAVAANTQVKRLMHGPLWRAQSGSQGLRCAPPPGCHRSPRSAAAKPRSPGGTTEYSQGCGESSSKPLAGVKHTPATPHTRKTCHTLNPSSAVSSRAFFTAMVKSFDPSTTVNSASLVSALMPLSPAGSDGDRVASPGRGCPRPALALSRAGTSRRA